MGYVQASVDSYNEAIRQDKDYAQAYYFRAIAYGGLKDKSLAIKDLQIAAIALANDMTLVTHNTAEFERVAGLQIEDWEVTD